MYCHLCLIKIFLKKLFKNHIYLIDILELNKKIHMKFYRILKLIRTYDIF